MKKQIIIAVALIFGAFSAEAQFFNEQIYNSTESNGTRDIAYSSSDYSVSHSGKVSGMVNTYYSNGNLEETGLLVDGEKHGVWHRYSENGAKLTEAHYTGGAKDGTWKVWDENGVLRVVMVYSEGKRVGEWLMYDANGDLQSAKTY